MTKSQLQKIFFSRLDHLNIRARFILSQLKLDDFEAFLYFFSANKKRAHFGNIKGCGYQTEKELNKFVRDITELFSKIDTNLAQIKKDDSFSEEQEITFNNDFNKLSVRAKNILRSLGICDLESYYNKLLINDDLEKLNKVRNCGIKTINEISILNEKIHKIIDFKIKEEVATSQPQIFPLLDTSSFNVILKGEFEQLSVRSQNALLTLFGNKLPTYEEFTDKFIKNSFNFLDLKNVGSKSAIELGDLVSKINQYFHTLISKPLTSVEEIFFKVKHLTEIEISDLSLLESLRKSNFNIIEFFNLNLRNILTLKLSEETILRNKLEILEDSESLHKLKYTNERVRQIGINLLKTTPAIIHAKGKELIKYSGINDLMLNSDFIDIGSFEFKNEDIQKSVSKHKLFATFILESIYKSYFYSLSRLNKIKKPGSIQNYEAYSFSKSIKGYYLINNEKVPKDTIMKLLSDLLREVSNRQEINKIFSLNTYFQNIDPQNHDLFFYITSNIINKEFEGVFVQNNTIYVGRNTPKLIHEYAIDALHSLGRPSHISEIYSEIIKHYKSFDSSISSLQNIITRSKNIFIYFGRSSTFGLREWEGKFSNIKGGTIRDIVEEYLNKSEQVCHISEITDYVNKYRSTNERNILTNLKLESRNRFKYFRGGYIGLASKNYIKYKDKMLKYEETSLDDLLLNIFSK